MKITLYGASGMIGSRILDELVSRQHDVTAVVRHPSKITRTDVDVRAGDVLERRMIVRGETEGEVAFLQRASGLSGLKIDSYAEVLQHIPEGYFDFPDLVQALLTADLPVGAYPYDGLWFDIGQRDDYERAVEAWLGNTNVAELES